MTIPSTVFIYLALFVSAVINVVLVQKLSAAGTATRKLINVSEELLKLRGGPTPDRGGAESCTFCKAAELSDSISLFIKQDGEGVRDNI